MERKHREMQQIGLIGRLADAATEAWLLTLSECELTGHLYSNTDGVMICRDCGESSPAERIDYLPFTKGKEDKQHV
jgi:hypothetical protein